MQSGNHASEEIKARALTLIDNGLKRRQVAERLGIHLSTLSKWIKRAMESRVYREDRCGDA